MNSPKTSKELKRLVITCGGTGGHFFPGLSIAREFKEEGGEVLLFLSGKNADAQADIATLHGIDSVKLTSSPRPNSVTTVFKFTSDTFSGIIAGRKHLKKFNPDALLAMGSFTSLPSAIGAWSLNIPIFLHDGNARVGKANRFLSRWAKHLCTAFPPVNASHLHCPYSFTGMPVRPELIGSAISKKEAIESLNIKFGSILDPALPTMLIFGGSQGAEIFNRNFPEAMLESINRQFQVLHLTGHGKFEMVNSTYEKAFFPFLALPSASEMDLFYQAADVVVARSGGSTVAELTLFGKFAFLIPYPYAAEDHQYDNALYMKNGDAAEIINNAECTKEKVAKLLDRWLENPEKYRELGALAKVLSRPHAAADTLQIIRNGLMK
ncbi:MAG: UDP-N-acetylglucosamine--N-acetylmuramyl-(pentapeptide) pyrophosphoryl-undecaprenol N-acetylglucosamine transferase [Lentisphaerota bacterium]